MADALAGGNVNFSNAAEAARLQIEAITALGQFKIAKAQAELIEANARGEFARARAREVVVTQLHKAFKSLAAQNAAINKRIATWEENGKRISLIQDGETIGRESLTRMWLGYKTFQRLVTIEINRRIDAIAITSIDRHHGNYNLIGQPPRPLSKDLPDNIDNLSRLIAWLQIQKNVMPCRGTSPFSHVRDAFLLIAGLRAQQEIASLKDLKEKIEDKTLNAWQPIMLAPFLDNTALQKLVELKPTDS